MCGFKRMQFKVGDKVVVVKDVGWPRMWPIGATGIVIKTYSDNVVEVEKINTPFKGLLHSKWLKLHCPEEGIVGDEEF